MATDDLPPEDSPTTPGATPRRRRWPWLVLLLVALVPLAALLGLRWLSETPAGHAFAARQIETRFQPASGLRVSVGRIEGSLLSDLSLHEVTLRDLDGPFASAPVVRLSWNPASAIAGRLRIRALDIPDARLDRLPRLEPADPDEPLLPDIRLAIGRLSVARLQLAAPVAGRTETLAIEGSADIGDGRLFTRLETSGTRGDRLALTLDSAPDRDRFDLKADLLAPRGGLLADRLPADLGVTISGEGGWKRWRGVANARLGTVPVTTLGLALDGGRIGIKGDIRPETLVDGAAARVLGPKVSVSATADLSTRRESPFTLAASGASLDIKAAGTLDRKDQALAATRVEATLADPRALDPQLSGGPLALVARLEARLRLADGLLRAEALRLTTPALSATGAATVNPETVAWTFTGSADLPRYSLEGTGSLALSTSLAARSLSDGTATASGRASVRTLSLASAGARDFLGGLPSATLPWTWDERGNRLTVSRGSLAAPALDASPIALAWSLDTDAFTLDAAGRHRQYGAFALAAGGTLDRPRATLRLPDPGLAVGLRQVVLDLAPAPGGFTLTGTGETAQGPGRLAGFLEAGESRPLALRIDSARLAGFTASGRVEQTPAGPFAGALAVEGTGLDARVLLSAAGAAQQVAVRGSAAQAFLPLSTPVRIGAGEADLVLLLAGDGPRLSGTLHLRNLTRADLALASLEAEGDYSGDAGRGTVRLSGAARGQPLSGTISGTLKDGLYRLLVDGRLADVPLKSRGAIRLRRGADGFALLPSALAVGNGELRAAGTLGAAPRLRLSATGLELALLRSFGLDLPVRGTLDGDADLAFPADAFPVGRARLALSVETPPSPLGERPRIDLALDVTSSQEGLTAAARLAGSYGSTGRLLVRLAPGPGETLSQRFLTSALSGGIRFFGPADTAWSLLDVPDQQLSGTLGLAADFSGTLGEPSISGGVRGEDLSWRHLAIGTRVDNLVVQGRFSGADLELLKLDGRVGDGRVSGTGRVRLSASASLVDLALTLDRAKIADNPAYRIRVSGPVTLRGTLADLTLGGSLEVSEGELNIGRVTTATTTDVKVRRRGAPLPARAARESRVGLDVALRSPDSIKVEGLGLDSFWGGRVRLGGDIRNPRLTGEAVAARGTYDFAGRSFDIARGRIGFTGDPWDSTILVQASSLTDGFEAGVLIGGTARRPTIGFTSIPPLPDDEVLARLLFGSSVADLNVTEAVQLASALASLRGGGTGGIDPIGRLRRASGLDRIRLTGGDATTGMGTGIAIGERIGRNLYVEIATDTNGNALTNLQFTLTRVLSLLVEVTTLGDASANLRYARDY